MKSTNGLSMLLEILVEGTGTSECKRKEYFSETVCLVGMERVNWRKRLEKTLMTDE